MPDIFFPGGVLTVAGDYKPGDQPPSGYLDWHEWAEVQHKAGLRQKPCGRCGLLRYPQEMSGDVIEWDAKDKHGRTVMMRGPLCNKCKSSNAKVTGTPAALSPEAPVDCRVGPGAQED